LSSRRKRAASRSHIMAGWSAG